jgi:hypothetical protein
MPQLYHATDSPLQALALVTRYHNSRMCRSGAECMETVWRSLVPAVFTGPPPRPFRIWRAPQCAGTARCWKPRTGCGPPVYVRGPEWM